MSPASLRPRRWLIQLCGLVMALSALAPTVSRALAASAPSPWAWVCTAAAPQEGLAEPAAEDNAPAQLGIERCPLCLLMAAHQATPPHTPAVRCADAPAHRRLLPWTYLLQTAPAPLNPRAWPRAPPLRA